MTVRVTFLIESNVFQFCVDMKVDKMDCVIAMKGNKVGTVEVSLSIKD